MDKPNEGIFERSLSVSMSSLPPQARQKLCRTMSNCSLASTNGYAIPVHHNTEDFVAPVLDAATEILYSPESNLSNVNIVCCNEFDEETEEDEGVCGEECNCSIDGLQALHHHHHALKKPRSRSRSRSSICKSLMSSMSPNMGPSGSLGASQGQTPYQSFSQPLHSGAQAAGSGAGGAAGPVSPSMRSSKSNISLLHHMSGAAAVSTSASSSGSPDCKTIPFYSFADMLDNERVELEHDAPSPPDFRGFSFASHASKNANANKDDLTSQSPPQGAADGYTTLTMKEYISNLS